ncbi:MAG: redoxin family protein, partial [Bacteroidota bacterium]
MRLSFLYLSALLALLISSCSGPDGFSIKGTTKGLEGKTVYLQKFSQGLPVNIDSAVVGNDGSLAFETKLPFTDYYQLFIDQKNTFVFIGDSVGELSFTADQSLSEPTNIEGQEDTKILYDFDAKLKVLMMKGDSIMRLGKEGQIPREEAVAKLQVMNTEAMEFLHGFIDRHTTSPAALAALNRMNPMQDMAYFKKVLEGLSVRMAQSEYYSFLNRQIQQVEQQGGVMPAEPENPKLAAGQPAPPISLPDPKGKTHSLEEFKGKVVLIDFWASWCGPCRNESPNVVKAYNAFHPKGFEILSVSLDKNATAWTAAIAEDKLNWTHVSELKYWQSKVVEDYGITGIPFTDPIKLENICG